jgi:hypothetical protein
LELGVRPKVHFLCDKAALAEVFLPGFGNVDGDAFGYGKSLATVIHRLARGMGRAISIHKMEVKLARAAGHPRLS